MLMVRTVDTQLYPLNAIHEAVAEFSDRCVVDVRLADEGKAVVSVESSDPVTTLEFWNRALESALIDRL